MKAGVLLLQDEQPDVRDEAARFASLIPRDGAGLAGNDDASTLHSTIGLQVGDWFTYILKVYPLLPYFGKKEASDKSDISCKMSVISTDVNGISWCRT